MCSERVDHVPDGRVLDGFVLDLDRTGSAPLRLVGGKALNLGKLAAAGFPVPRGFCLTTDAYRLAAPAGLDALAARLDTGAGGGDEVSGDPDLGHLAASARGLIGAAAVP